MNRQKSIAFLCHPYHRGGVTRWMADAAAAFANKGWQVHFVTVEPTVVFFSGAGRETLLQLLKKTNSSVQVHSKKVGREFELGTPAYRIFIYRQLLSGLPTGTPVILSDDATVWAAATDMHTSYPIIGVLHADELHYYDLAKRYSDKVAVFTCVSERVHRVLLERVPQIPAASVHTIPCGINLPSETKPRNLPHILQLAYVGRITQYQKRTGDLAAIAVALREQHVPFHLHIIGDGTDKNALQETFRSKDLGHVATFHGWLPQKDVTSYLAASDILILTSDFEGTPIAMMEALAAGCGVVGTRVSGIEDYESNPLAADCYGVYTVGDIAEAIKKIMIVASVTTTFREKAARKLAESEFSMDICIERYTKAMGDIKTNYADPGPSSLPFTASLHSKLLAAARYLKATLMQGKSS